MAFIILFALVPTHYFTTPLLFHRFVSAANCCILINFLSNISSRYFLVPLNCYPESNHQIQ